MTGSENRRQDSCRSRDIRRVGSLRPNPVGRIKVLDDGIENEADIAESIGASQRFTHYTWSENGGRKYRRQHLTLESLTLRRRYCARA
jgi:hypothetical protein